MYRISYPDALRDGIRARFGVTWPAVPPPVRIIVFINACKFVKKPAGARPGMVTYDNYRTLYVTPEEALVKKLAVKQK